MMTEKTEFRISDTTRYTQDGIHYMMTAITTQYDSHISLSSSDLSELDHQSLSQQLTLLDTAEQIPPYTVVRVGDAGYLVTVMPCFDVMIDDWMLKYPLSEQFKRRLVIAYLREARLLILA